MRLRQRALGVEREQRVVGAVAIEVRRAVGGRARRREAAFVEMRRESQARRVAHRVLRAALLIRERLPLPQLVQRARRRIRRLEAAGDRAVGADLDAGLLEEPLAERVRHGRARERQLDEHGMIRRHGVELGERREARRAGRRHELIDVEAADRRDPLAARQRGGFRCAGGASTSSIEAADSRRVSCPGRSPSSTMWL